MELEDLKKDWKLMEERIDKLENQNQAVTDRVMCNRVTSAQQRLKREYQMMTAICLYAPSWVGIMNRSLEGIGDWTLYAFFSFFLILAALKISMWWRLSHWDFCQMTVKEALLTTYKLEKYQKMNTLAGITLGVPLLLCFIFDLYLIHNMYAFYGAWCGLVIGIFVGLKVRGRIKREIKELRNALDNELS